MHNALNTNLLSKKDFLMSAIVTLSRGEIRPQDITIFPNTQRSLFVRIESDVHYCLTEDMLEQFSEQELCYCAANIVKMALHPVAVKTRVLRRYAPYENAVPWI